MPLALDGEPLGPVFEVQVINIDGLLADVRSELEEVGIRLVCAVDECVGVARRQSDFNEGRSTATRPFRFSRLKLSI